MIRKLLLSAFLLLVATSAQAANRFAVCTVTCTWDASSTAMWSTSTGGATGASAPGTSDVAIFDAATCVGGVTCTITPSAPNNVQQITLGACTASTTGCILDFSVNNNSMTLSVAFSNNGTGTRNLKLGSGTFTLSGASGTVWDFGTVTNLTFAANTSVIDIAGTATASRVFSGGGLTYNTVKITNPTSNYGKVRITSAGSTFANFIFNANTRFVELAEQSWTITGAITFDCATAATCLMITSGSNTAVAWSLSSASSLSWLTLQGVAKTAGAGSLTCTNCFDAGGNSGITITQPSGGSRGIIGG